MRGWEHRTNHFPFTPSPVDYGRHCMIGTGFQDIVNSCRIRSWVLTWETDQHSVYYMLKGHWGPSKTASQWRGLGILEDALCEAFGCSASFS